jgi:uncharacterized protein (TIGR02145 family)
MRTTFLFFAMLASMTASAAVTVTPLSVDYSTKKVTFRVSWTNSPTAPYNNRVWIWIDFCPVNGITPQSFSTATISNPAKTGGNGTITNATTRGFFIEYAAANAGTTVTAVLSNASGKFNWCAYGSDYPPNATFDKGTYTFNGTTDFIISNPAQTLTTKTIAKGSLTVNSSTTFTDATGCPGIGSLYCPYTGSDLYMDATHLCQQRTSGAKNWEAWIKDTRDNEYYRIVLMPDNKWWLAQNVKLARYGSTNVGSSYTLCSKEECGRGYTVAESYGSWGGSSGIGTNIQGVCPNGWLLPSTTDYQNFATAIQSVTWSSTAYSGCGCSGVHTTQSTLIRKVVALDDNCVTPDDQYGWASKKAIGRDGSLTLQAWRAATTSSSYCFSFRTHHIMGYQSYCPVIWVGHAGNSFCGGAWPVRCLRQL